MRILILSHEFPPIGGGGAVVTAALAREYARNGHSVSLVTMNFGDLAQLESVDGCELHRVACGRQRRERSTPREGLTWASRSWPLIRRLHADRRFEVVHAHFIMPGGTLARRCQRELEIPYIVTPHGSDVPGHNRKRLQVAHMLARPWWRRICRQADRVVSPSAYLLELIESTAGPIRGQVIPNGFDPSRFAPRQKQNRILSCGRLIESKGFQHLLTALRDVNRTDWKIDIVGDGPMRSQLTDMAAGLRIPVQLHGWVDNADPRLPGMFGRAAIFVLPSEWENFSIVLLEAMSSGCAVITTAVAGNPEVIGAAGCLVPRADPQALRDALLALMSDHKRRAELGRLAAERAENRFTWNRIAASYQAVLSGLRPAEPTRDRVESTS